MDASFVQNGDEISTGTDLCDDESP